MPKEGEIARPHQPRKQTDGDRHHALTAAATIRYIEVRSNSMEPCCQLRHVPRQIVVRTVCASPPINSKNYILGLFVYSEGAFTCHMYANE
jgi:hypothetical protein